jgi:hypothetical protein
LSAGSRSSNTSSISTAPTLPPSEVPAVPPIPISIQKIISPWPSAMFYSEILEKKTALERSLAYAGKINELYIHDCGLGQFLMDRQTGGKLDGSKKLNSLLISVSMQAIKHENVRRLIVTASHQPAQIACNLGTYPVRLWNLKPSSPDAQILLQQPISVTVLRQIQVPRMDLQLFRIRL